MFACGCRARKIVERIDIASKTSLCLSVGEWLSLGEFMGLVIL